MSTGHLQQRLGRVEAEVLAGWCIMTSRLDTNKIMAASVVVRAALPRQEHATLSGVIMLHQPFSSQLPPSCLPDSTVVMHRIYQAGHKSCSLY